MPACRRLKVDTSRYALDDARLTWMGLVPAATIFMPSAMMAALRMVAVVVPSPAVSLVLEAACRPRADVSSPLSGCALQLP